MQNRKGNKMFVIRHKENKNYYKSKITKNIKHFVVDINEAKKFKNIQSAKFVLNTFNHFENYEIVRIKNERYNNI